MSAGPETSNDGARLVTLGGWAFAAGMVLFAGSLYVFALTGTRIFALLTPLGGLALLGGWAALAVAGFRPLS